MEATKYADLTDSSIFLAQPTGCLVENTAASSDLNEDIYQSTNNQVSWTSG